MLEAAPQQRGVPFVLEAGYHFIPISVRDLHYNGSVSRRYNLSAGTFG